MKHDVHPELVPFYEQLLSMAKPKRHSAAVCRYIAGITGLKPYMSQSQVADNYDVSESFIRDNYKIFAKHMHLSKLEMIEAISEVHYLDESDYSVNTRNKYVRKSGMRKIFGTDSPTEQIESMMEHYNMEEGVDFNVNVTLTKVGLSKILLEDVQ